MNDTLEAERYYEQTFENDPSEFSCENKLGFTALCAACPLVTLFGDCPKEIVNSSLLTPSEGYDFSAFEPDHSIGFEFDVPLQSQLVNEQKDESIEEAPDYTQTETPKISQVESKKPSRQSYLELLLDDSIPVVLASVFQPPKKEIVQLEPQVTLEKDPLPIVRKDVKQKIVTQSSPHPELTESTLPIEPVEPLPLVKPREIMSPKVVPESIVIKNDKPVIKKAVVAQEVKPSQPQPKQSTTKIVAITEPLITEIALPTKPTVNKNIPIKNAPVEIVETINEDLVVQEPPIEELLAEQIFENIIIESAPKFYEPVLRLEPAPEYELEPEPEHVSISEPESELEPLLPIKKNKEQCHTSLSLHIEEQPIPKEPEVIQTLINDTPEILTQNNRALVSSLLKNVSLLLGSFVLKITL